MFTRKLGKRAIEQPVSFWGKAAEGLHWSKPYSAVATVKGEATNAVEATGPLPQNHVQWFAGGELNLCYNCIDRHVEAGFGNQRAIIYDSPLTKTVEPISYTDLLHKVSAVAHVLTNLGVKKGDRVVIFMPMIPEAIYSMLACARIGAIHSVVFGGFASAELAKRLLDADPTVIICGSFGLEPNRLVDYKKLVDEACEIQKIEGVKRSTPPQLKHVLLYQRWNLGGSYKDVPEVPLHRPRDVDWDEVIHPARSRSCGESPCVPVSADQAPWILYTSGTTGLPKGILRELGGYATMLHSSMSHIFGLLPGETMFTASDIGWIVGHNYTVYAPLISRVTSVLYEGKPVNTPDAGVFWRLIEQHKIDVVFTAPTALRAVKQQDPDLTLLKKYNIDSLRALYLAGERSDTNTLHWISHHLGIPVIDHYWQTESGSPITSAPNDEIAATRNELDPHVRFGAAGIQAPGWNLTVLDDNGQEVPRGTFGTLVARLPLPPGAMTAIYNRPGAMEATYFSTFPGYYNTFDAGMIDEDDFVHVLSRTDDVINVAGHRLSTGQMEDIIARHPMVAECAVVGAHCPLKGEKPVALFVLKAASGSTHLMSSMSADHAKAISKELEAMVREELGRIAVLEAHLVKKLPKTRSGKIVRKLIRQILNGEAPQVPPTIEDLSVVLDLTSQFPKKG